MIKLLGPTVRKLKLEYLLILALGACQSPAEEDTLFTSLPPALTGIEFRNTLRETEDFNVMKYGYFYNGGGVAIGDVDNDGWPDIYFTGNLVASRLYLNQGDWTFEEVAEEAGVAAAGLWNTGVTMADVNGDGLLDIYVCRSAAADPSRRKNLLFINETTDAGPVTFTEQATAYGLADPGYSTQAAFFDYDRDGDLDMYLLNHSTQEYAGFNKLTASHKQRRNPMLGDKLFRNDLSPPGAAVDSGGQGVGFTDISSEAGIIQNVLGFGLGVAVTDVNADGWYDIYVTNDYNEEDYLYVNRQDGTFKESLRSSMGHTSLFSMGCDAADVNNDALPDIITLDMLPASSSRLKSSLGPENHDKYQELLRQGFHPQTMRNMLQINNGSGPNGSPSFSEVGQLAGVGSTDWSWAALLADYDNDGHKDLFVTNGYLRNYLDMDFMNYVVGQKLREDRGEEQLELMKLMEAMPAIEVANYAFQNLGGLSFQNQTQAWGLGGNILSNGAAYGDLDNDGDLDLVVNNVNDFAAVYRNNSEKHSGNRYLTVQCQGSGKNTFGLGAKVWLYAGGQTYFQELMPTRGFQSAVNPELLFGVGVVEQLDSLEVQWPTGETQVLPRVATNQTIRLKQSEARKMETALPRTAPWLVPSEDVISYRHRENDFQDFKRDKLLAQGISTAGPKLAVGDVNGDGYDDLYLGGAKGFAGQLFAQRADGTFAQLRTPVLARDSAAEDTDALFFDADRDGDLDLYVVSGGSDFAELDWALQDRLYRNDGAGNYVRDTAALPAMLSSGSSVAAADVDQDGDTDLFVGGRLIPGRYPQAPRSYLLRNDGTGRFRDATADLNPSLLAPGMVTNAVWTDLDQDGWPDLVMVGEWMPIRVFMNREGQLEEVKFEELGQTSGWWNTVEAHDVNNDGYPDLVAGNQGGNNQFRASPQTPVRLYFADFDQNGAIDPLLTYYIDGEEQVAFSRDELIGQMVSLRKKFPSYADYSRAKLSDVLSEEQRERADTLMATCFETVWVRNEKGKDFSVQPLPVEAQFAPVYAILPTEINGDSLPDLLLGGNLTNTRVSTGRYDASYGTVLINQGSDFAYAPPRQTCVQITGDVRDIAYVEDRWLFARNNDSVAVLRRSEPPAVSDRFLYP
ncbi:MAG: VCBS repeat-containing protein [Tunicatimonas sp.]